MNASKLLGIAQLRDRHADSFVETAFGANGTFCFVHAADLHLDTPFTQLHSVAPEVGQALLEASLNSFDTIVEMTIQRGAAFFLVAGDIYDGAERGLRAQLRFHAGLERLSKAGIASFIIHGNHDPVATGWSAVHDWPPNVVIFPPGDPHVVQVRKGDEVIATVQGISYATSRTTENLALRLRRPNEPGFAIGMLHCNVQGRGDGHENYAPCTIEDLANTGLDYLALGHIHQYKVLSQGKPWVVYPGNIQARSPKPSERGAKGAVVVEVARGEVENVLHVPCDMIRFYEFERSIENVNDLVALEELLLTDAESCLDESDGRSIILRARLVGRGSVHDDLRRKASLEGLLAGLRENRGKTPFFWWDQITDETLPERDLAGIQDSGGFSAELLNIAKSVMSDPTRASAVSNAVGIDLPASFRSHLSNLISEKDALRGLIEQASIIAIDELDGTAYDRDGHSR